MTFSRRRVLGDSQGRLRSDLTRNSQTREVRDLKFPFPRRRHPTSIGINHTRAYEI